jgi:hypothetical protein
MNRHVTPRGLRRIRDRYVSQCEARANRCGGGATAACDLLPLPPSE